MQTIVSVPLGTNGNLSITESAGKLNLSLTLSEDVAALLAGLAAGTTNSALKLILSEAAAAVKALPA